MTFRTLTDTLYRPALSGKLDVEITSIAYDSRKVQPGTLFVALRGSQADGHKYISAALAAGAVAVIAEQAPPSTGADTAWAHVADSRLALAKLAAVFHGQPQEKLALGGVTGTNGKSTTACIIRHLLNKALLRCGLLGTMFYDLGRGRPTPATHTTPESLELFGYLSEMSGNGCKAAAMEVSSHALHQHRVAGISWKAAVFTNLTQDHLDYHGTMQAYFEAKTLLFETVAAQKSGKMIINGDDLYGKQLIKRFENTGRVISYGFGANNDLRALNVRYDTLGTQFELNAKGRQYLVRMPLIGDFNVYNALGAVAAADAMGVNFREALNNLKTVPQVPGRMERVSEEGKIRLHVYVDYAHTPDALVKALATLRTLKPNRIITVFGCGGDRDRTKRPLMARAAEEGSDICILTSDNPRHEDPEQIIADAKKGFYGKSNTAIADRQLAIKSAIMNAKEGDIVLIAGKGHEDYQDIKGVKWPFDDRRWAAGYWRARNEVSAQERLDRQREHEEKSTDRMFREWEDRMRQGRYDDEERWG
jgi:UDP-N-acetylmuramoyl-L-alanyl-D-glutamate--2,6-diaminopimelate ligase